MEKDTEKTKVIFRKEDARLQIVAFFPEIPGTNSGYDCLCYTLQTEHSHAMYEYYRSQTKPASFSECKDIIQELENMGYNLQIIKRWNEGLAYQVRKAEINKTK